MIHQGKRGFTLIELLIVVAIIAILAAIAVPNFLEAQVRSKLSRVYSDIRTLRTGLEAYHVDYQRYPIDWGYEERRTWAQLTTPVAFLTSIPNDVFYDPNNRIDVGSDPTFQPYAYGGGTDVPGDTWWVNTPYPAHGVGYFLYSCGPNMRADFVDFSDYHGLFARGPEACADILYNPTNGTKSYGDIFATNKGIYNL